MKAKLGFLFVAVLMSFSMAFSAAGSKYYNLYSTGGYSYTYPTMGMGGPGAFGSTAGYGTTTSTALYLEQDSAACFGYKNGKTCVASVKDTPENLYTLLNTNWVNRMDKAVYSLHLMSDLDLGEFSETTAAGKCDVNHVPLQFPNDTTYFFGDGFTVRNLCYASSTMDKPVGFFEKVHVSTVNNLTIKNVRIVIDGESTKGEDYYPAGALAGVISYSSIDTLTLQDVYIDAPLAGGAAGYVSSCTFRKLIADDDIEVVNNTKIESGYAGSSLLPQSSFGYGVFLGGVAGVITREKPNATFLNDTLKVVVHNNVSTNNAAIGGLAGLYSGYSDSLMNVRIYNKTKAGEADLKTQIYGGTAMGGFFGMMAPFVDAKTSAETVGNMDFQKCQFNGVISGSNFSGEEVALGGLVGRAIVRASSSFKIKECESNVEIKDEVKAATAKDVVTYNYYVGGLIGENNRCENFNKDGDFLTIEKSKTTGSITVAASAQSVSGLHMKSYVGGLVGDACLSVLKGGTHDDSSSVNIDVKIKTAVDSKVQTNGSNAYDSVFVGGLFGGVSSAQAKELLFNKVLYSGTIALEDSLNTVMAGGLVGNTHTAAGGKKIIFKDLAVDPAFNNSSVTNPVLMTYTSKAVKAGGSANISRSPKLGGICGACTDVSEMSRVSVNGAISATASYGDTLMLGGIAGSFRNESVALQMKNVYTVGDLGYTSTSMKASKVGYLFGYAKMAGFTMKSMYHYGENDVDVGPFGTLFADVDMTDSWDEVSTASRSISYVIRNGATSLNASNNGLMVATSMKKSSFAGLLNSAYSTSKEYVWRADQTNDGLPYFAYGLSTTAPSGLTSYKVDFVVDGVSVVSRTVLEGDDAVPPETDPVKEGYRFKTWEGDYTNVASDLIIKAVFDTATFTVCFYGIPNYPDENYPEGRCAIGYEGAAAIPYGGYAAPYDPKQSSIENPYYTLKGYTLVGWNNKDGVPDSSYMYVTKDMGFYPRFERNRYAVIYVGRDGKEIVRDSIPYGLAPALRDSFPWDTVGGDVYFKKDLVPNSIQAMPDTDVVVKVIYDSTKVLFKVVFRDFDGNPIEENPQMVPYGGSAVAPAIPSEPGRVFKDWSNPTYKNVISNVETKALYDTAYYKVTFLDYNGKVIDTYEFPYQTDLSVADEHVLVREDSTSMYDYKFLGWTPALGKLVANDTVRPMYQTSLKKFPVVYMDDSGIVYDTVWVEYGSNAKAPENPTREGFEFVGWSSNADSVTSKMTVVAQFKAVVNVVQNKMIASFNAVSSGNALRVTYETQNVSPTIKTDVRLVIEGKNGVFKDEILTDSLESASAKDTLVWRSVPGDEYKAMLIVSNALTSDTVVCNVKVESRMRVAAKTWQMVALASLKTENVSWGDEAVFYWWDEKNPIGEYWQYRSYNGGNAQMARGYWYGASEENFLILPEKDVVKDSVLTWELDSLYSGWNMVANPYGWAIDLSQGESDNDANVTFWYWNPTKGDYEKVTAIGPYQSVWAKVNKSTSWTVPAVPYFVEKEENKSPVQKAIALRKSLRKASADNWTLMVTLSDNYGRMDSWNAIGAGSTAETLEKAPTGMGEYVRLVIAEGKNKLAKSVKPVASEYQWTLDVSANRSRKGSLSFDGMAELKKAGLSLYVTVDGVTQEVTEGNSVPVALTKSTKSVNVRVAPSSASAAVVASKLSGFRMVQDAGSLQVSFNASENLAGAAARYTLVDVKGKKMAAGSFTANAGANSISVGAPKSGIYFMQLKIGSQMSTTKVMVK